MHIITTIYCTELKLDQRNAQDSDHEDALQPATSEPAELTREFLSIYQGRNRVEPMD